MKTSIECFLSEFEKKIQFKADSKLDVWFKDLFPKAKQMEKEQMIAFAEFIAKYPDKNKNANNEMLHAKSKYDRAERTADLLDEFYNKTNEDGAEQN